MMTCTRCAAPAQGFQPLGTVTTREGVGRCGCMNLLHAFLFGRKSCTHEDMNCPQGECDDLYPPNREDSGR